MDMDISGEFTAYHQELLNGTYDCVDRIVVNAYYPLGQRAGGFRTWWRQLTGSDETLDRAHLERLAGAGRPNVGRPPKNSHPIDIHYQNLLHELKATFQTLGLTA